MRTGPVLLLLGAIALLPAAACGPIAPTAATSPIPSDFTQKGPLMAAFDENLAKWQAAGITRYAFTYQPQCFCDITTRLVVADGREVRIDGVPAGPVSGTPVGVPGLFDFARRAIKGDNAAIEYDPVTGVPIHLTSDPVRNAIDDELTFTVTHWTLEPPDDQRIGDVSRALARWQAQQILDYSMTLTIDRDIYHVKVRDASPAVTKGGRRLDPDDLTEVPTDVWQLLRFAADYARTGSATVTLDDQIGYPRRIVVDGGPTGGSGQTIEVTNFKRG